MAAVALAVALVLVFEGSLYALFPDGMKRAMEIALAQSSRTLRAAGLAAAVLGVLLAWFVQG